MQVKNEMLTAGFDVETSSVDSLNSLIADARRTRSRTVTNLMKSYFGILDRHARRRPSLVD